MCKPIRTCHGASGVDDDDDDDEEEEEEGEEELDDDDEPMNEAAAARRAAHVVVQLASCSLDNSNSMKLNSMSLSLSEEQHRPVA